MQYHAVLDHKVAHLQASLYMYNVRTYIHCVCVFVEIWHLFAMMLSIKGIYREFNVNNK